MEVKSFSELYGALVLISGPMPWVVMELIRSVVPSAGDLATLSEAMVPLAPPRLLMTTG